MALSWRERLAEKIAWPLLVGAFAWGYYKVQTEPVLVVLRARSEVMRVQLGAASSRNVWFLRKATVKVDDSKSQPFTGEFAPGADARVAFQRLGTDSMMIIVEAASPSANAGRLSTETNEIAGTTRIAIAMSGADARGLTFPFSGNATVGAMVAGQTAPGSPYLIEGKAQLIAKTPFSDSHFIAATTDLLPGDEVEVEGKKPEAFDAGFVRVDNGAGMQVAIDAPATGLRTRRFLSADAVVIHKPFLLFFEHDGLFFLVFAALGVMLHGVAAEYGKHRFADGIRGLVNWHPFAKKHADPEKKKGKDKHHTHGHE